MPSKIERLGAGAKYGLRVTVEDDGMVKFTITSAGGKKQHANVKLHPIGANGVARHILSKGATSRPRRLGDAGTTRITGSAEARETLARKRQS